MCKKGFLSFVANNPLFFKILKTVLTVISIGLTIFIYVSSFRRYSIYINRPNYNIQTENRMFISNTQNTTNLTYYMVRENATYRNCSTKARFEVDIGEVYYMIVSKSSTSSMVLVVFWLNFCFTLFLTLFDIFIAIKLWATEYKLPKKVYKVVLLVVDKLLLKLWLSSTMAPPTYFVGTFDVTKVCLESESVFDTGLMRLVVLGLLLPRSLE